MDPAGRAALAPAISAVSLAGPMANLVLAAAIAIGVALTAPPLPLAAALSFLGIIQVLTFVLNLLPIPGLDGWGVIDPYLPYGTRAARRAWRRFGALRAHPAAVPDPGASACCSRRPGRVFALVGGDGTLARLGNVQFARLLG